MSTYIDNDSFTTTSSAAPGEHDSCDRDFSAFERVHDSDHGQEEQRQQQNSFAGFRGEAPALPKEINSTFVHLSRITRSRQECSDSSSKMSKWYDFISSRSEREFTDVGLQQLDAKVGERILEIGCGTGYATSKLAQKVGPPSLHPNASVVAVDISQGMIDQARSRLEKQQLLDRTTLLCCDVLRLPFANNTFDAVFMSFVVELFDNAEIPLLLSEVLRVLKSGSGGDGGGLGVGGGRFTIVALVRKVEKVSVRMYEWFHKKFPSIVDCRPIYIRETLAAMSGLVTVTKHSEHTMWTLPVEVVTARKRDDDGIAATAGVVHNNDDRHRHRHPHRHPNYIATEAEKMIMMDRDESSVGSRSSSSSTTSSSANNNNNNNSNNNNNDSFPSSTQATTTPGHHHHYYRGGAAAGSRESVLGDPSALVMGEFGAIKFKTVPRSQWMEDEQTDNCYLCKKEFGFFTRKHHCRTCGMLVCSKCSEEKVTLNYGSKEKERVCDSCFQSMNMTETEM